jgi:hypothetical protein
MSDARFEDGAAYGPDAPLRLLAQDAGDIPALSALIQDAVFTGADITYLPKRRRFAMLLSRFRWEDRAAADAAGRPYERVKSLLVIDNITALRRAGFDPQDKSAVRGLLALTYAPQGDLGGTLTATLGGGALGGGGAIAMDVEAVDITLRDMTRPHLAIAKSAPHHGD